MRRPVLVSAGGTGGHVFPALAVAEWLRARGVPVVWLGTPRGLEAGVAPAHGIEFAAVAVSGLRGKGLLRLALAPFMLAWALVRVIAFLARRRPAVVLGMGGYVAGPAGVAAWLLRIPLVVHEQNAVAGLTNRLLAPLAKRVLEAFPGTFPARYAPVTTGNPVRAAIAALAPPQARARDGGPLRLLVLGGSQGAAALNACLPEAVAALGAHTCEVWHQCGAAHVDATRERYRARGVPARVDAFISDMAQAYGWASLAVCRAGALTVSELAAAGVAAVLVPFPYAVDDHQSANARYLVDRGAAILVPQAELGRERLAALLAELARAPGRLAEMARRARELAVPDAAARVAGACLEVARA